MYDAFDIVSSCSEYWVDMRDVICGLSEKDFQGAVFNVLLHLQNIAPRVSFLPSYLPKRFMLLRVTSISCLLIVSLLGAPPIALVVHFGKVSCLRRRKNTAGRKSISARAN